MFCELNLNARHIFLHGIFKCMKVYPSLSLDFNPNVNQLSLPFVISLKNGISVHWPCVNVLPVKSALFLHYRLDFSIRSSREKITNGKDTTYDALGIMKYPIFTYLPLLVDFKEINGQEVAT